mmetsp:Transcript_18815/g.17960  ORF Transcript_18815/g.17960 Transcript_18815/m.17960 type:complete len:196 (+) Transcript_18815:1542-2129(+)
MEKLKKEKENFKDNYLKVCEDIQARGVELKLLRNPEQKGKIMEEAQEAKVEKQEDLSSFFLTAQEEVKEVQEVIKEAPVKQVKKKKKVKAVQPLEEHLEIERKVSELKEEPLNILEHHQSQTELEHMEVQNQQNYWEKVAESNKPVIDEIRDDYQDGLGEEDGEKKGELDNLRYLVENDVQPSLEEEGSKKRGRN